MTSDTAAQRTGCVSWGSVGGLFRLGPCHLGGSIGQGLANSKQKPF
jgi:hypothetical protein